MSKFFKTNRKRKVKGILSTEQLKRIKKVFPEIKVLKSGWDNFEIIVQIQPWNYYIRLDIKLREFVC